MSKKKRPVVAFRRGTSMMEKAEIWGLDNGPDTVADYEDWGYTEESAKRIALCLNMHDELLAALQELVGYDSHRTEYDGRMVTLCPCCGEQNGEHRDNCDFVRARAVIAKATGAQG